MSLATRELELIDRYLVLPDPQERLSALVARAGKSVKLDASERIEENLVRGCVSQVWLVKSEEGGICRFRCEADSPLVAGLAAVICDLCHGASVHELSTFQPIILEALGIWKNLSPTRQRGIRSMVHCIQQFAASCL